MGAAFWSLRRINWQWQTPLQFVTDAGEVLPLPTTSPALLKAKVAEAWQRKIATYAAERLGMPEGSELDPTIGIQLIKQLSHPRSTMISSFLVKTIWTQTRLHKAGYDVCTLCPLCKQAEDTLQHRLFRCARTTGLCQSMLSDTTVQILDDPAQSVPLLYGFQLRPGFRVPRPPGLGHHDFDFRRSDPTLSVSEAFTGECFTDGSAALIGPPEFHSAAWAAVKLDATTAQPFAILSGPVGRSLPATSRASEHVAGLALLTHCPRVTEIHTDLQGLAGFGDPEPSTAGPPL